MFQYPKSNVQNIPGIRLSAAPYVPNQNRTVTQQPIMSIQAQQTALPRPVYFNLNSRPQLHQGFRVSRPFIHQQLPIPKQGNKVYKVRTLPDGKQIVYSETLPQHQQEVVQTQYQPKPPSSGAPTVSVVQPTGNTSRPLLHVIHLEALKNKDSKMLLLSENGEQRLITFTLPNKTCTLLEVLDQVGVQVSANTHVECFQNPGSDIDYIVKIGNFDSQDTAAVIKEMEDYIRQQAQKKVKQSPKLHSSELPPPKYINGFWALCYGCGFSGIDHAKCLRCHRVFTVAPKVVRMPQTPL